MNIHPFTHSCVLPSNINRSGSRNGRRIFAFASIFPLFVFSNFVNAAGFALIEHSASGMGNAFAGSSAIAEDASTVYFNPAGMSNLPASEALLAGHFILPKGTFTNNGTKAGATSSPISGDTTSDLGVNALVPNVYVSHKVDKGLNVGLGINVPFGLTTQYDDDWVGRYHAVKSDMKTININPSIALQLTDKLSIGGGFNMQQVEVTLTSAVDFGGICIAALPSASCTSFGLVPQQKDGFATIEGDGWSNGLNFGALYKINENNRIGLSYRSSIKHSLEGTATFIVPFEAQTLTASGAFSNSNVSADLKLPAIASMSVVHGYGGPFSLLADLTWTQWSSFQELRIDYENPVQADSVTTSSWEDVFRASVAANYQLNQKAKVRLGLAYDQSPIPDDEHRTPRIPGSDRIWITLGAGLDVTKSLHVDVGYAYIKGKDSKTNNTLESKTVAGTDVTTVNHTLIGSYESSVNIFSAQLRYQY